MSGLTDADRHEYVVTRADLSDQYVRDLMAMRTEPKRGGGTMSGGKPQCGAIPPNVGGPIPCHLDPDHEGRHFSTSGCAGSEIRW